ncbi:MAG: APC family permease [Lentihominibacter sp.]
MNDKQAETLNGGENLKRDLGLFAATAIGVSQMIGTGIYMAPQGLAELSNPTAAIIACLITGIGTLLIALSFGRIGEKLPVSGSAIAYTRAAFGETPSFIVGWSYWWSNILGVPAIATGTLAYASFFIPALASNSILIFICGAIIMWLYTLLNIYGVKGAGMVNLVMTIIKLIPLVVFFIIAAMNFDSTNYGTVSDTAATGGTAVPLAVGYLIWSFMGFEGSSINAGEVKDSKIVKKATILTAATVMVIYIMFIVLASGSMSQSGLAASTSPVADIIAMSTGKGWAGGFIALGVTLSGLACVGAWIISSGRITYSLGKFGLFPSSLGQIEDKHKVPKKALIVNAIVYTIVIGMSCTKGLVGAYNMLIIMSSMASMVFYSFGVASEIALLVKNSESFNVWMFIKNGLFSLVAFAYTVYATYATGAETVMWGFLFILIGMPFFIYIKMKRDRFGAERKGAGLK